MQLVNTFSNMLATLLLLLPEQVAPLSPMVNIVNLK
jgi:hypothetical protein